MRDKVADPAFVLEKKIERRLAMLLPDQVVPKYTMVTFSPQIPYAEALRRGAYLRPLGNTVYVTPPINIPDTDLDELLTIVEASVRATLAERP